MTQEWSPCSGAFENSVSSLQPREKAKAKQILTPKWSQHIPHLPTERQRLLLWYPGLECFYGGAAGGGKSVGLLMAALQYVDVPGYSALLLRRTYADLNLPKALMNMSKSWLMGTDAHWSEMNHTWTFPSGATLTFGYLDKDADKYRYQSSEYQFIGFDELTQFTESQYLYLFSRLRKVRGMQVPLRIRAASNPGGVGHDWVKERFINQPYNPDRLFIPARLTDNPHLNQEEYIKSLGKLGLVEREQLLNGDWSIKREGNMFKREWFEVVDAVPGNVRTVRFWDLAATAPSPGTDPDYTVGLKMAEREGVFYVVDVRRDRLPPGSRDDLMRQTAQMDGQITGQFVEEEPGSAGKSQSDHFARNIFRGFTFMPVPSSGSKLTRAQPVAAAAYNKNIKLVRGPWVSEFFEELEMFPDGPHDDQVDAFSGAFSALVSRDSSRFRVVSTGRVNY